jgi:exopolyphosphatase/guanosine-5'-triphosphate,3'-diphosphate pyrophosphatase
VLFCTHSAVIQGLLRVLELAEPERTEPIPCKKGSVWVLEGAGYTPSRATYFEPVRRRKRSRRVEFAASDELEHPSTVRAAVLDMGSTSFTLLIADASLDGEIRPVVGEKVMLRLGAVVAQGGEIPPEVCERALSVAEQLRAVAEREKAELFLPVATAALRDAGNGKAVADAISDALGQPIRTLSGEEEARLIFRAFQARLGLGEQTALGLDLGGGSLELALGNAAGVQRETTLPLGAVRLHGELVESDPMTKRDVKALRRRVREALEGREVDFAAPDGEAIATGGTVRALARVLRERERSGSSRGDAPPAQAVSREELKALCKELAGSSHAERLAMRGVRRQRADLLPTGALVLHTLADVLGVERFTICDWGLRQGVILDALARRR